MFEQKDANVKVFQYDAFADRIVSTHRDYKNWLDNNYIHVYAWIDENAPLEFDRYTIDYMAPNVFGYHPLLEYNDFRGFLEGEDKKNIIDIIQKNSKTGSYWYLNLDQYYLKQEADYQKNHFIHDVLVVEDTGSGFKYIQYLGGNYSECEAPYKDFYDAFCAHDDSCCYRIGPQNDVNYEFDLSRFKKMLKAYLECEDGFKDLDTYYQLDTFYNPDFYNARLEHKKYWGIDTYDIFEKCIKECLNAQKMMDYRVGYAFYEHISGLCVKLERCYQDKYIVVDKYTKIMEELSDYKSKLYSLLLIIMKYNVSLNGRQLEKQLPLIENMKKNVKRTLLEFYESLVL